MAQDYTQNLFEDSSGTTQAQDTVCKAVERNLNCVKSSFSGASMPSVMSSGQFWYDTAQRVLKVLKADQDSSSGGIEQWLGIMAGSASWKIWFYNNVALAGWVIDTGVADVVCAVKGGTGKYNVSGGTLAGSWTGDGHTHSPGTLAVPSHQHKLWNYVGTSNNAQIYNSSGTLVDLHYTDSDNLTSHFNVSQSHGQDDDRWTLNSVFGSPTIGGTTDSASTPNTYRPRAAVGSIYYPFLS